MADSPNELTATEQVPAPPHEEAQSLWSAIKESIRGSHRRLHDRTDRTLDPPARDSHGPRDDHGERLRGRRYLLGIASRRCTDAAATVGLTESLLTLIYALAIGLSIGAMAMVARRIGEQNPDGAARAAVQAIALALIVSIVIGAVGAPLAPTVARVDGWLAVGSRARRPRSRE